MSSLSILLPALAGAAVVVMLLVGYRLLRSDPADDLDLEDLKVLRPEKQRSARGEGPVSRLASALAPWVRRRLPPKAVTWLQKEVDYAGRPDGLSVDGVIRSIMFWVLLLMLPFLLFVAQGQLVGAFLCVVAAPLLPMARLARLHRMRREAIDQDLPDFLDILAVTVTAGVGFRPALMRVSERFGGPLAEEIGLTMNQVQHGATVRGAFERLRDRSDSDSLSQFVTAFLQSDELGAPLAEALNQIAIDQRREHSQRLRRKAAQMAPRVTLVATILLVPGALLIFIVGLFLGSGISFGDLSGGA